MSSHESYCARLDYESDMQAEAIWEAGREALEQDAETPGDADEAITRGQTLRTECKGEAMPATALRLFDIPEAIREIELKIIEADGELTPEVEAELDALEEEFDRKAEYIAVLSREAKAEAAAVKQEEDRLRARRTAAENRERRLKDYLHDCMTRLGVERVDGQRVKVALQANGRPSISWEGDPEAIPEAFRRVTVGVDGVAAYEAWKAAPEGERAAALPDGFRVEVGTHVRIR